jgi:methionyl-tRNA synthetase
LDALVNYLTAACFNSTNDRKYFNETWPVDVHVIGKDILRFHAIFWPAFLMAANLPLPKRIFCHGHWLVDNKKMSKSIGNVIDPFDLISKYTKDGVRFYLLYEGVPNTDTNISSVNSIKEVVNTNLSNTLGNLYQRCLPFNPKRVYPSYKQLNQSLIGSKEMEIINNLNSLTAKCENNFDNFNFYIGLRDIMTVLHAANSYVQQCQPWDLIKKDDLKSSQTIDLMLYLVFESLRISGLLLQCITPNIAEDLLNKLNVNQSERFISFASVDTKRETTKIISKLNEIIFKRIK